MSVEGGVDAAYRKAVGLDRAGRVGEAEALLRAVIAARPDHAGAHHRLGIIEHRRGHMSDACEALERAWQLDPKEAVYAYTLGLIWHDLRDFDVAAARYADAIRCRPSFAEAWNNLGLVLQDAGKRDEALRALEQALRVRPGYTAAEVNLANVLVAEGDELAARHCEDEARACFRRAWALRPRSLPTALKAALTLPAVPASAAAMDSARAGYAQGLDDLHATLPSFADLDPSTVPDALAHTNFLLAYQGRDDRALQSRYGDFVHALLARAVPAWMQPLRAPLADGRRIRVGFVSRLLRHCTVGLHFRSWVTGLDRSRFESAVFALAPGEDDVTAGLRAASDRYIIAAGSVATAVEAIRAFAPDVLVYPEVGMDACTFVLAALRLAPVQCAGWGHPVTSGLPNVDRFISAAAFEPAGAQDHYRERLVLLPGIGTAYPGPRLPGPKSRAELGLPEGRTLYLFPHSPFKIHPDNDAMLARILAADERGTLVLFAGNDEQITRALMDRLQRVAGIDPARAIVLPVMDHDAYLCVNAACDVMLDSLHWSGGNTSLDALASALPAVTLPGTFMRGRQTAGILKLAGVPELVARNDDDYVRIAVRLGRESAWRGELRERLQAGRGAVFDRKEPVEALQRFLEAACNGRA